MLFIVASTANNYKLNKCAYSTNILLIVMMYNVLKYCQLCFCRSCSLKSINIIICCVQNASSYVGHLITTLIFPYD